MYDGSVLIYDVREPGNEPALKSVHEKGKKTKVEPEGTLDHESSTTSKKTLDIFSLFLFLFSKHTHTHTHTSFVFYGGIALGGCVGCTVDYHGGAGPTIVDEYWRRRYCPSMEPQERTRAKANHTT